MKSGLIWPSWAGRYRSGPMTDRVLIWGSPRAVEAMEWAQNKFGDQFVVDHNFPSEAYRFYFDHADHAILFALRWAA